MKKLTFLLALSLITTFAFAQRGSNGNNGNRGGNGYHHSNNQGPRGGNGYSNTSARGQRGDVGYNDYRGQRGQRGSTYYRESNGGSSRYYGGTTVRNNSQRVRWEYSSCGRYEYRIVERNVCRPGRYVYRNGCRTWVQPISSWNRVSRTRYARGCNRW